MCLRNSRVRWRRSARERDRDVSLRYPVVLRRRHFPSASVFRGLQRSVYRRVSTRISMGISLFRHTLRRLLSRYLFAPAAPPGEPGRERPPPSRARPVVLGPRSLSFQCLASPFPYLPLPRRAPRLLPAQRIGDPLSILNHWLLTNANRLAAEANVSAQLYKWLR